MFSHCTVTDAMSIPRQQSSVVVSAMHSETSLGECQSMWECVCVRFETDDILKCGMDPRRGVGNRAP